MKRKRLLFNGKEVARGLPWKGPAGGVSAVHGFLNTRPKQRSELYDDDKMRCAVGSDPVDWTVCNLRPCPGQRKRPYRRAAPSNYVLSSDDGFNAGAADVCGGRGPL